MCDKKTTHNIYQSIKIENHINDINDLSEIINQKKVYENKIIMTEYEIEYLAQSIIKLIQNIQEIKIDTNYIDKYQNGYFLENTIEYELIDNIKTGMEVYLLSDLKIKNMLIGQNYLLMYLMIIIAKCMLIIKKFPSLNHL